MGWRNSAPFSSARAVGSMPAAMATVVMTIGRARSRQASMIASCWLMPSRSRSMAYSTSRIEFLAARPSSIRKPISDGIDSDRWKIRRPMKAPPTASGRAERITAGLKKLRNSSTSTPKIIDTPAKIASRKPPNSSAMACWLPIAAGRTPAGRCFMIGRLFTAFCAWPICTPLSSARTVIWRSRFSRSMRAGPAWKLMSATLSSVVEPPDAVGTRRALIRWMSARAVSGSRMRIGMRRSPSLYLATLASMSPTVATRTMVAMVSEETPSRAASSAFGRIRISGASGGLAWCGSASSGNWRISRSSSTAARCRFSGLSPVRIC